jgi:hypothetical protein
MKRIVLHVGGDKCGSSSIQSYLTKNPTPERLGNQSLQYSCLLSSGILGPSDITKQAGSSISGYVSSADIADLQSMKTTTRDLVRRFTSDTSIGQIFSCEGWLRSLTYSNNLDFLLNLLSPPSANNVVEIYAFVRPPVKWINSAWWQWGAWSDDADFEKWLQKAISATSWSNFLSPYIRNERLFQARVMPIQGDVVKQFCETVGINHVPYENSNSNVSMPLEVIKLMKQYRHHRPSPHYTKAEFLLARSLSRSKSKYDPTPWVLDLNHIKQIISMTKKSNLDLLDFMSDADRTAVMNDPSWWDSSFYKDRIAVDPFDPGNISSNQALKMASDLLDFATESASLLSSHNLMSGL